MKATLVRSVLAVIAATGCGGAESDLVRAKAAGDLACDERAVVVRKVREIDPEETLYEATACGRSGQYRCSRTETAEQPGTRIAPSRLPRMVTSCVALPAATVEGPAGPRRSD